MTEVLDTAVAEFGSRCKEKLPLPGEPEANIRGPIESLLRTIGESLGLAVVPFDEASHRDRGVRPDYGISVDGAITGYLEVKRPGANLDPDSFTGHNKTQWERQRDFPNLMYTNGTEWRLYRGGEPVETPACLSGGNLQNAGSNLKPGNGFEQIITDYLRWEPVPITTVIALVRAVAPLTRLLRGEVLDQLAIESQAIAAGKPRRQQPFHGLASDWRKLLFPSANGETFADGYAQTVAFALLLARTEGIDLDDEGGLHLVGDKLSDQHSLMARALQLLTDYVAKDFRVTLDLLRRVIGAVDWPKVRAGRRDTYLHLYEKFLEEYDPDLRQQSGSYYTPHEVVDQMVRLTDDVLITRLNLSKGFGDPAVVTADAAMGTGTFLHSVIERVASQTEARDGKGAVPNEVTGLAGRLYGFELQMGPFAVAELRTTDLLADLKAELPREGLGLYVTDTLDDPYAEEVHLGSGLELISQSRSRAAKVKAKKKVTVVIGNPPYDEQAQGRGGWIENGSDKESPPLDDFRAEGNGRFEYVLKNMYIYFWRWATWKVFAGNDMLTDGDSGIVSYISTLGYLRGAGFRGMREYLRRNTCEGWIINVSPEGMRPNVPTRIFPGVQQPLAIAIFVRHPECRTDVPATIHYTAVEGTRDQKYAALANLEVDSDVWREARSGWQSPFTPAADSDWDSFPAVFDMFPWTAPGIKASRKWIFAPDRDTVRKRLTALISEQDLMQKAVLFKETSSSSLGRTTVPLAGTGTEQHTNIPFEDERIDYCTNAKIIRIGYRSFDRQWVVADKRLMHRPSPDLWAARGDGQIFTVEQHAKPISDGPGLVFSALLPDGDYFKGSESGRVLPLLHPGNKPNLAIGLQSALSAIAGTTLTPTDVLAYVAGIVAHPAFTQRFSDELTTPGIRVPITTDSALFAEAVQIGLEVLWLHTFGTACIDPSRGRAEADIRLPEGDPRRILNLTPVAAIPVSMDYDESTQLIHIGDGTFGPVAPNVWQYAVGGKNVIRSWFNYRRKNPTGRQSSPLDEINAASWKTAWNGEFIDLLSVLTRLEPLHDAQDKLLMRILDSPLASMNQVATVGVTWPGGVQDEQRKADYSAAKLARPDTPVGTQIGMDFN